MLMSCVERLQVTHLILGIVWIVSEYFVNKTIPNAVCCQVIADQ